MSSKQLLIVSLILGSLLTALSIFFVRHTTAQHCSSDPAIDAVVDCDLRSAHLGLPFSYYDIGIANSTVEGGHKLSYGMVVLDIFIWSAVVGGTLVMIKKLQHGRAA